KPFGINHLLFNIKEDGFAATLEARPPVIAFAWAHSDQDMKPYFDRAKATGAKVMYMVNGIGEARKAVAAGADVIVAQGTEGGGHVGCRLRRSACRCSYAAAAPRRQCRRTAGGAACATRG